MPRLSNAHSQLQVPNDKSHLGFNPEGQHAVHDLPKESVIEQVPPGQPIVLPLPSPLSNVAIPVPWCLGHHARAQVGRWG